MLLWTCAEGGDHQVFVEGPLRMHCSCAASLELHVLDAVKWLKAGWKGQARLCAVNTAKQMSQQRPWTSQNSSTFDPPPRLQCLCSYLQS